MNPDTPNAAKAPRLYLFDLDAVDVRRDWDALLPVGFHRVMIDGQEWRPIAGDHRVSAGLVLAHASSFDGLSSREQDAALEALARDDLHLVLVAGGASQGEFTNPRVYRRQRFVGKSKVPDAGFRACFAEFWHHFAQTREAKFLLLEPLDAHHLADLDSLCAGYVIAHVEADATGSVQPSVLAPTLARLGLAGMGSPTAAVRDRLARQRETFRSPDFWAATLGGNSAGFARYRERLAIEFTRRYSTTVPPGITALLDAIAADQPIEPALVADAVRAFPEAALA